MATINWFNNSSQVIKWVVSINGQLQSNALEPGQSFQMDDANVDAAGWICSGFTGFTTALLPSDLSPGFAAAYQADDHIAEGADLLSGPQGLPSASGDY